MRSRLLTLVAAAWTALGGAAAADGPVVVELFTSQGCSSCPPADKILAEIAERDDIIALALHVDYWDYIGWKDLFAKPAFTLRQRAYAHAAGERSIYTPQMIVGGVDHVVGTKPMKLAERIAAHADAADAVSVRLSRSGDRVSIEARAEGRVPTGMVVQLVTYTPKATVEIGRGENAGRRLSYHNIVRDWVEVGTWDGRGVFKSDVRVSADMPVAVLVQARDAGPILGAAKTR
ncbi:DUF1223 domain-containing protein [Silicimonas sp. MF1-12-2]|jgi:hypothetical protein|uniref:DUF1223 domain-containing protein n=1 Tax=Silicimonas sp. MF1-12-2 TaxID=3384793 RepID=UPI0039B5C11A